MTASSVEVRPPLGTAARGHAAVGLMVRRQWIPDLLATHGFVDYIGCYAENYWWRGAASRAEIGTVADRYAMVSHGMSVPMCGPTDPPEGCERELAEFLDFIDARWWSEHLGIAHHRGENLHEILPFPLTRARAELIARRADRAIQIVGRPLLLENGAAYFRAPGSDLDEPEFLHHLFDHCEARWLLDVNNLYVNSQNFGFDPFDWLDRAPLDRVGEIHIAGFSVSTALGLLIDSHGAAPSPPVWRLLDAALARTGPCPVLLEWDSSPPEFDGLAPTLQRIRAALDRVAEVPDA